MTTRLRSTFTLLALLTTAAPIAAQSVVNNGAPNSQAGWVQRFHSRWGRAGSWSTGRGPWPRFPGSALSTDGR